MLKVIAQDFIRPEHIATVLPLYRELVEKTRQEPLCLSYELFVDQKDPGHFTFIETWPDRAALDTHCATEHFQRLVPQIDRHQSQPGQFLLMDVLPGTEWCPATHTPAQAEAEA
ncbi:putative quinol monooxygenase [Comamonas terrigena]|uniref:putative quinol monooxygenase n=1 Tax=Comamonas terrigena TaxID=32013 RepID=UPI00244B3DE9|nr:putative quinol monooxygenase [Comamonas terrigena]MDH1700425.1 antibiotic biosynthesis monooxygenase [Comamonas terrigena]